MVLTMSTKPVFGKKLYLPETVNVNVPLPNKGPKCYLQRRIGPERTIRFKSVKLVYNNGFGATDAILRNYSPNGAKIETDNAVHLPDKFLMTSPFEDTILTCYRVWRNHNQMGVKFIPNT